MAFKILAEDIDTFNFIKEALDNLHPNISKQIKIAAKNGRLIECDFLNEEDCKEFVEYGHYILIEKQINIDIQEDIYTYCYIHPKFYLVGNL